MTRLGVKAVLQFKGLQVGRIDGRSCPGELRGLAHEHAHFVRLKAIGLAFR